MKTIITNTFKTYDELSMLECYSEFSLNTYQQNIENIDLNIVVLQINKSDSLQLFSLLYNVYLVKNKDKDDDQLYYQLSYLARDLGLYDFALELCSQLLNDLTPSTNMELYRKLMLIIAKAYRGHGKYHDALRIYQELLDIAHKTKDDLHVAYQLLMVGKLSSNFLWRTGYYRQFLMFTKSRLIKIIKSNSRKNNVKTAKYYLAICYDCLAQIEFDLSSNSDNKGSFDTIIDRVEPLFTKSLELMKEVGSYNSTQRVNFRRIFILFQITNDIDTQWDLIEEYEFHLERLQEDLLQKRGLTVRYGQLAQMYAEVEQYNQAKKYIDLAIDFSMKYSDWRTLANNNLRAAKIYLYGYSDDEMFILHSQNALWILHNKMIERHPELEVAIYRERAKYYLTKENFRASLIELEKAYQILQTFEKRLLDDYAKFSEQSYLTNVPELKVLNKYERLVLRNSLLLDYQLFSSLLQQILSELKNIAIISANRDSVDKQLGTLNHYMRTWLHRLKNIKDILRDTISEPLIHIQQEITGSSEVAATISKSVSSVEGVLSEFSEWIREKNEEISLFGQSENFISVRKQLNNVCKDVRFEMYRDSQLTITVEETSDKFCDFKICCNPHLLEQAIINYVENASRVLFKSKNFPEKKVILRVFTSEDINLGRIGVIEIEDSMGAKQDLIKALQNPKESSGLFLSKLFFDEFNAKIEPPDQMSKGNTKLRIKIPIGKKVLL